MATKYGTNGNNTIVGTAAADTIYGRGGNDVLKGNGGNDRLFGEAGNDTLYGGYGDDRLDGGTGVDKLDYSGIASVGTNYYGIEADLTNGYVYTSVAGNDTVYNVENIDGTKVRDWIKGNGQANVLAGKEGDDTVRGEGGDDRLYGGDGNDYVYGGAGNDSLSGGAGNDYLEDGEGNDTYWGGPGQDTFDHSYYNSMSNGGGRDVFEDFVRGQDNIYFYLSSNNGSLYGFYDLDSNGNGVLDNRDTYVSISRVTHKGVTASSTTIDVSDLVGDGPHSVVVFGVTGLRNSDFNSYYDDYDY